MLNYDWLVRRLGLINGDNQKRGPGRQRESEDGKGNPRVVIRIKNPIVRAWLQEQLHTYGWGNEHFESLYRQAHGLAPDAPIV